MPALWLVSIAEGDWDYDRFASAVVWAETAEEAESIVRAEVRVPAGTYEWRTEDELWIEDPAWSLVVAPAPTSGVALIHWHAG